MQGDPHGDGSGEHAAERTKLGSRNPPLRDLVAEDLRRRIVSGVDAPGSRLVEESLAAELGVSRGPVREALRVLAAEGYVELLPRRGALVAKLSDATAEEMIVVRTRLQALAARLAAAKGGAEAAARLHAVCDQATTMLSAGDEDGVAELNSAFHACVVEYADNPFLTQLLTPMRARIRFAFATRAEGRAAASWREHRELADLIGSRDEAGAADAAIRHIDNARSAPAR